MKAIDQRKELLHVLEARGVPEDSTLMQRIDELIEKACKETARNVRHTAATLSITEEDKNTAHGKIMNIQFRKVNPLRKIAEPSH